MNTTTKILVIEDELNIRESLAELLELRDYTVFTAQNGQDGIIRAIQHNPDLIICDVTMPVFDGYQVLSLIRRNKALANTPFLFLTAKTTKEDIREGMALGADDYLTKPFTSKELFAAVDARLARSSNLEQTLKQKLETFSQQFSAASYHEINTPLTGIISTSRFLEENFEEMPVQEVRELLKIVLDSGERLHRTLNNNTLGNQILMAKLSNNSEELTKFSQGSTLDASAVLLQVIDKLSAKHKQRNELQLSLNTSAQLAIAEEYFERVVEEILDNAFKFSTLHSPIYLEILPESDFYHITIRNEGRGFKGGFIRKINAFQQFDRSYYEQQGSGIGLFLAKSLVELNNGEFQIESEYEKETTVKISLRYAW